MKYLVIFSVLFLTACSGPDTIVDKVYLVKSGFFKNCVGEAKSTYYGLFGTRTMLRLQCNGHYQGYEFFYNSELAETNVQ